MEAFENIVAWLLEQEGYWVRTSFKVNLTKPEKRRIGRASSPRWEIDLIAYKPSKNEILAVECKSFLDSKGVCADHLIKNNAAASKRYKLFHEKQLRNIVFKRLVRQLANNGACLPTPKVRLCLAAGKIASKQDHTRLKQHFDKMDWRLFDRAWFKVRLEEEVAKWRYENNVAIVVAKILLRDTE